MGDAGVGGPGETLAKGKDTGEKGPEVAGENSSKNEDVGQPVETSIKGEAVAKGEQKRVLENGTTDHGEESKQVQGAAEIKTNDEVKNGDGQGVDNTTG